MTGTGGREDGPGADPRDRAAREMDDELDFHLRARAQELEAGGVPPAEARRRAEEEFGDLDATRTYCAREDRRRARRARLGGFFRAGRDSVSLAVRGLARRPGSVLAPAGILAVAVALNALVFTVVRSVLLAPLPFRDVERTVVAEEVQDGGGLVRASYPVLDAWRREARSLEAVTAYLETTFPLVTGTEPIRVEGAVVATGYFDFFDDPVRAGRAFVAADHRPESPPVAVVSEGLWRRAFAGDPGILDRKLRLDGTDHDVVGVVRDRVAFPDGAQVWLPVERANPDLLPVAGARIFVAMGRLRPGVDLATATRELGEITRRVSEASPDARAVALEDRLLGDVRAPLLLLQGAVLLVLLAACANAAGMLLARGVRRRAELALRSSLGAGRLRIGAELLTEGLLLGLGSGLAGLVAARVLLPPALALVPRELPRVAWIGLDPWVAAFALALAGATGLATSVGPALAGARTSPATLLRESGAGAGTTPWLRRALEGFVVVQVALAVVLTAGAGLLVRSFVSTVRQDPGFDPARVTLVDVSLPPYRYPDAATRTAFARELLHRAALLPGTEATALGRNLPITGSNMTSPLMVEGSSGTTAAVQVAQVSAGYFDVLRIPVLEGAGFGDGDREDGPPILVADAGVRTVEGGPLAVGARAFSFFGAQVPREVVGVVGPVRHQGLRAAPAPIVYEPFFQKGGAAGFTLMVRSGAPAAALAAELRRLVRSLDPELPVDRVATMASLVRGSVAGPRFYTVVLSVFGALAVLLAVAGCQAGLAHRVAARRREIGLRLALGASARSVRRMVLRRGLALTGAGVAVGLAAARPATRLLESQLYGVGAADPVTWAALLVLLFGAAALASDRPARRASAVDPAETLRDA